MNPLVKLAKTNLEQFVKTSQAMSVPQYLSAELAQQRACYVYAFQKPGRHLRAMFGGPLPRQRSLAEEIIHNSITILDYASRPIKKADLSSLTYAVAVLEPLHRISNKDHLDPENFGLYLTSDRGKSSIILPQRTGIETPDDQVAIAMREAGIQANQEVVTMYRFLVTYHE